MNDKMAIRRWDDITVTWFESSKGRARILVDGCLSFGLLVGSVVDTISPADIGISWWRSRPKSAFLLGRRDGQMALDVEADGQDSRSSSGVFFDNQLTQFGFQSFVQCVFIGLDLAAVDIVGWFQLRRMHPRSVDRCHRLGFLLALLVQSLRNQRSHRFDQL